MAVTQHSVLLEEGDPTTTGAPLAHAESRLTHQFLSKILSRLHSTDELNFSAMSSGDVSSRRPHVLVIAFPSQGHLLPLLDFAHLLSTCHHVHITVATTPSSLPLLSAFLASTPLGAALPIPLPDPSAPEHVSQLAPGTHHALLAVPLSTLRGPLVSWARSQRDPPTTVLSDFFLGSAQLIADDLRVPRIVFYSSGVFATAVVEPLWNSTLPLDPSNSVVLGDLPGSPSIPYRHVPSVVKSYVPGDPDWELAREGFLLNSRAWGAVLNTFEAMEGDFLEHLKRRFGHGRVWAVGPISASGCRVGESPTAETEKLFSWLADCPARSVLYVCFGSMYKPPPAQAAALGAALEASGVRFIWAVGADVAVLPEGLEERARGRGRVVRGWAPQMEILRHAAVGAFVTHYGWNLTLEGVAAGVTLVTWPMKADQFIDARLIVNVHGAAVRAAEGQDAVPDPSALSRVFADDVDGVELAGVRDNAATLAAATVEAVEEGGTSWLDLERMAKELEAVVAAA